MLEGVLCRMQAFRATPPHPILRQFSLCFLSFSVTVFGKDFFMVFHAFHLSFFNAFSMNFRSISHHSFRSFLCMYLRRVSCRFSSFSEILLFRRHAFYTVNTMVLTHSAPRKNLVSTSEKNEKKNNLSLNFKTVFASKNHQFSGT